jgi:hypothetical protein
VSVAIDAARPPEASATAASGAMAAEPADRPTGPARVLVRTLGVLPGSKASLTGDLLSLPDLRPADGSTTLLAEDMPEGVRLVVVGLVPAGGVDVDPASLRAAWIAVTRARADPVAPAE